jgi:hypothetical protein
MWVIEFVREGRTAEDYLVERDDRNPAASKPPRTCQPR